MTHEEKMLNLVERYRSLKFILLNYQLPEDLGYFDNLFKVYNADAEGGAMAAEELYRRGHREFAVLSYELHCRNYARRTDGFRRKLVELGVSNSRIHFRYLDPFRDICTEAVPQAEALTRELLASHPGATAFFAVNDYFASGSQRNWPGPRTVHNMTSSATTTSFRYSRSWGASPRSRSISRPSAAAQSNC